MIADDFAAIAQRLYQLVQQRRLAQFILPDGVTIACYGSHGHATMKEQVHASEMCFVLHGQILYMVKTRSGNFVTATGVDMIAYLGRWLPSAKQGGVTEIHLSPVDARLLTDLLTSRA